MTTNQTIDGVPRELLEDAAEAFAAIGMFERLQEMRALLDAPACPDCKVCVGSPLLPKGCTIDNGQHEPATQHQGEPVAWRFRWDYDHGNGWCRNAVRFVESMGHVEHEDKSTWRDITPLYAKQPAPVAVEYKLHMGEALKVFEALKVSRISRKVEREDLGPMGATEIEAWSTAIGVTLEMHTDMGGCTLIVRTAPVEVVMPSVAYTHTEHCDTRFNAGWNACLDELKRLNTKE